jgi:sugar phosphate isomerase/epimerase
MRLGIGTYTYTWAVGVPGHRPEQPLSAEDLVRKANSAGLHCAQIADNLPLEELSTEERHALAGFADSRRVAIEVGGRRMTPDHLARLIDVAAFFGSHVLRFVIDGPGFAPPVDEVVTVVREALPRLREAGVKLAIENHDRLAAAEFLELVKRTDEDQVGICLDSVNSMGAGEAVREVTEVLAPYTLNLHVKDFTVRRVSHMMGFVVEGTPAGQGMLDIPWLLEQVRAHGRCQSAILEQWTPPESTPEKTVETEARWAEESLHYLKPLFAPSS